ncbi:unnamed protein product [Pleuronectes platessa]|uniref:Uncharacterized protein n=1 Tax=Pleuronectes platessa TaxID=8262 RepID=A0A9N7Z1T3_PLEPL|nr:unnamed protein product [Pleuronectes platessa]
MEIEAQGLSKVTISEQTQHRAVPEPQRGRAVGSGHSGTGEVRSLPALRREDVRLPLYLMRGGFNCCWSDAPAKYIRARANQERLFHADTSCVRLIRSGSSCAKPDGAPPLTSSMELERSLVVYEPRQLAAATGSNKPAGRVSSGQLEHSNP